MRIIDLIKKHRLYKYIKENNALFIFLLTVAGTAFTFIVRGIGYLYYYAKYKVLSIPTELIKEDISSVSLTITIISIILGIVSVIIATLFDMFLVELKSNKDVKLLRKIVKGFAIVLLFSMFLLPTNYVFLMIQNIIIENNTSYLFCTIISIFELTGIHFVGKQTEGKISGKSKGTIFFVGFFMIIIMIGFIYDSGVKSATSISYARQIVSVENVDYIVLEKYDDSFVLSQCEKKDNILTIHTDKQKIVKYDNLEYENKKFDKIVLEGNEWVIRINQIYILKII